ncbi:MAG TPA: type I-MYXAN CRISPR-associated endonuclease Cas1 [Candidatus Obscuribacterales bacterium]
MSPSAVNEKTDTANDLLRVNSLHALKYCPRLFYLEEVEELYTQDDAIFAGRRLHAELERSDECDWQTLTMESEELGLRGKVDAVKTKQGAYIPYEHKRGHCCRQEDGSAGAWESDRIQLLAYCMLIEKATGAEVTQGRIRYHADNVTVTITLDEKGRADVLNAITDAMRLRESTDRPPVTENEKLCVRCSLAPICLPEEARLAKRETDPLIVSEPSPPLRLFPAEDDRKILHVVDQGTRIGRSGDQLKFEYLYNEKPTVCLPINDVGQVVINGNSQISTQAIKLCAEEGVGVHYLSGSGNYIGCFQSAKRSRIQQKIRQFSALSDPQMCLRLAKQLVECKIDTQRQMLKRSVRRAEENLQLGRIIKQIKILQGLAAQSETIDSLRGFEGSVGALYFSSFGDLISKEVPQELSFCHRNRRPPRDRVNALLGYGYGILLKDVVQAINVVGLEPAFGFFHQPRSSAPPLALDLMEIFRVLLVDIPVVTSINRQQWDTKKDFVATKHQVWLSDEGKKKFIGIYERRKADTWKHPVIGYSMHYSRIIELEVRLLEKEWMHEGGLFARLRLR